MENPGNGKLRRREGIKRGLRDTMPVSYEEYDTSWDLEDQSKRCQRSVNCLLASCRCKRETTNEIDMQEGGTGGKEGALRVRGKPRQWQIEKKRRDKGRFTRYYAGEL